MYKNFKNKVIIFYTIEELEEACKMFPYIFVKDEYFYFYYSEEYTFPIMVWNIKKDSLCHQGLKDLNKWEPRYIELIKRSINWKDFIQKIKKKE